MRTESEHDNTKWFNFNNRTTKKSKGHNMLRRCWKREKLITYHLQIPYIQSQENISKNCVPHSQNCDGISQHRSQKHLHKSLTDKKQNIKLRSYTEKLAYTVTNNTIVLDWEGNYISHLTWKIYLLRRAWLSSPPWLDRFESGIKWRPKFSCWR